MRSHGNQPTWKDDTTCPLCLDTLGDPISDMYLYCPVTMRDEDGCPETDKPSGETPPVDSADEWVASCKTEPLLERLKDLDGDKTLALMCGHRIHAACLKNTLIQFANKCPMCKAKIAACSQVGQVTQSAAFNAAQTEEDRALALEMQFDENLAAEHQRRAAAAALAAASIREGTQRSIEEDTQGSIEFAGAEHRDQASVNASIATFLAGLVVGTPPSAGSVNEGTHYDDNRPMSDYETDIEKFAALMREIARCRRLRVDPENQRAIQAFINGSVDATVELHEFEDLMGFLARRGVFRRIFSYDSLASFFSRVCHRAERFLDALSERPNHTRSQMIANASFLQHTLSALMKSKAFEHDLMHFEAPQTLTFKVEREYTRIIPQLTIDSLLDDDSREGSTAPSHIPQSECVRLVWKFRDGVSSRDEITYIDPDSDTHQWVSFFTSLGPYLGRRYDLPVRWRRAMNEDTTLTLNYWLSSRLPHMPEDELVSLVEAIRVSGLSFEQGDGIDEVSRQFLVFKISTSERARAIELPFDINRGESDIGSHSGGGSTGTMATLVSVLASGLTIVLATIQH